MDKEPFKPDEIIRNINLHQCRIGDILAENVHDDHGYLIITKGTVINEHFIRRMETFGISRLSVSRHGSIEADMAETAAESGKPVESEKSEKDRLFAEKFKKDYRENLNVIKQVLGDMAAGRKLDYKKVDHVTTSVYTRTGSVRSIIDCMNEVRNIDEYTYTHCINVSVYAMLIARWLNLPEEEVRNIVTTGILHDIGKSRIPAAILNKKGPLLAEEFGLMKEHTSIGFHISGDIPELTSDIREGILMHHEREDGTGYPLGIKGDKINPYAKIISVADVYDALTSERVYKGKITPFDTFSEFEGTGYGQFDTKVIITFLTNIAGYYIGSKVRMNNGETGEVVYVAPQSISTPIVSIRGKYFDLLKNRQLKIVEML